MRPIPKPPSAELSTRRKTVREISVEVCLITRLYGGGVRPGQIDERSWIRPPAFKSALRFWWRAGHAHLFSSLAKLHEAESKLFGSPGRFRGKKIAGGPGLVEVRVERAPVPNKDDFAVFQPKHDDSLRGNSLAIAYFPAVPPRDGEEQRLGMPGSQKNFRARLILVLNPKMDPEDVAQVENALRLFLSLGGIGARSRRGAGAIAMVHEEKARELGLPTTLVELQVFLKRFLRPGDSSGVDLGLWSLAHAQGAWTGKPEAEGETAQIVLLNRVRELRQDRRHPSNWQGEHEWGQSRWPEADAIRWKAPPEPSWKHQPKPENRDRYPRASLGLPIIVHFKGTDSGIGKDPFDHTISAYLPGAREPRINRFASPLLVRPVRVWSKGKVCYVPVAILGPVTLPTDVVALVELTKNSTKDKGKPPADPAPGNVIHSFRISAHAGEVTEKLFQLFKPFNRLV